MSEVHSLPDDEACACEASVEETTLVVDADDCETGDPFRAAACRRAAVDVLARRDAERLVVRRRGVERLYEGVEAALLVAAGRFADAVVDRDDRLSRVARTDPLRAARDATARAGPVAAVAAETGLARAANAVDIGPLDAEYAVVADPVLAPTVARARFETAPPDGARLLARRRLGTDAVTRLYDADEGRRYHLEPVELRLDDTTLATLADARDRLASDDVGGGDEPADPERAVGRAVRAVSDEDAPTVTLSRVLRKHTRGYGVLEDFFADDRVSDVYATAPVRRTPLRVVVDGVAVPTNVRVTPAGVRTLASRLRRESGRAFSRASPTLDATAELGGRRVRAAGVTAPVSDGTAFAFRDHGRATWTLPALVENDTLTAGAAALLSVAVERGAAGLIAGGRGTGKTTLLGGLLWEVPPTTRTVVIEDTPELPVEAAQSSGRDVQPLRVARGEGPGIDPTTALRTALRLGEGAIVVGEVRGEEASVLYEAMRVGAGDGAVLGTIHGDGPQAVRERVVVDLDVPESAFGDTDLVVTVAAVEADDGVRRQVRSVAEVIDGEESVRFEPLYAPATGTTNARTTASATPTGRVERGNSRLVADLTAPDESYADLRAVLDERERTLGQLAERNETAPEDLHSAYRDRARAWDEGRERPRAGER